MLTNKTNIALPLAVWLASDNYDHNTDPTVISTTSLLKPIKSIVLGNAISTSSIDIAQLVPSAMGTSIHTAIETAWRSNALQGILEALGMPKQIRDRICINPNTKELAEGSIPVYMELRRSKQIEGWTLSGKFDFVMNGRLCDFKSTSTLTYINQSNKDKYIQQASIYRWLNQDIITEDTFDIHYIFTDWSSVKSKQDSNYPQSRLFTQTFPLMSIEDTERFIKNRLKDINKYKDNPTTAPDCTSEELWSKESIFKYYKNPTKMDRSTKNFDSYWEAHKKLVEDGSLGKVVEVKGEVVFCKYCSAINICNQAKGYIAEGRLII